MPELYGGLPYRTPVVGEAPYAGLPCGGVATRGDAADVREVEVMCPIDAANMSAGGCTAWAADRPYGTGLLPYGPMRLPYDAGEPPCDLWMLLDGTPGGDGWEL